MIMPDINPDNLRIVCYPDPVLRQRAREIPEVTDAVRAVAQRMIALMHDADGVGLAGPQVGLSWRLFVANARDDEEPDRVYINPVLRDPQGAVEPHEEGCLSLPRIYGDVWRPPTITIEATDLNGERFTMTAGGMLARVWQHETDHLDGRLIIDRFGQIDKLANRKAIRELERMGPTIRPIRPIRPT